MQAAILLLRAAIVKQEAAVKDAQTNRRHLAYRMTLEHRLQDLQDALAVVERADDERIALHKLQRLIDYEEPKNGDTPRARRRGRST